LWASAYTTRIPVLEFGPAKLSVLRILVLVGIVRVLARRERPSHGLNTIDWLVLTWAAFLFSVSVFHTPDVWTYRLGMILGEVGVYLLCRVSLQDAADVQQLFGALCVTLVPLAVLMLFEKYTAQNVFAVMGGTGEINIREGHVRAYGPFAHSILAGTVGATCLPMALSVWNKSRGRALIGMGAALCIVYASTSSGPIVMLAFICVALSMWKVRNRLGLFRWGAVAVIIVLQIVMKDPVYFLMARIDITGGSTGWHRAQLIRSSLEHLSEWLAVGTDYTRHWMPTGIHANETQTDITNHFLQMGVWGGLPLLILFVMILWAAFRVIGEALRRSDMQSPEEIFLIWTLGAMLFGHVINFWSISLFDQSVSFFYLVLATIGAVQMPVAASASATLSTGAARAPHRWQAIRVTGAASGRRPHILSHRSRFGVDGWPRDLPPRRSAAKRFGDRG
jgi:hypothetical protein